VKSPPFSHSIATLLKLCASLKSAERDVNEILGIDLVSRQSTMQNERIYQARVLNQASRFLVADAATWDDEIVIGGVHL